MRIPPPEVIASWPKPDYDHPAEVRGNGLEVTLITLSVIVVVFVAARFYSRVIVTRSFGWDDALIIPAVICSLASNRMILLGKSGWDRHLWDLEPKYFQQFLICAFVAKLTLVLGSVFCRLSLICFYYRLIRDSSLKWFHNVLHASLAMNTLIGVAFVFLLVFACTPVEAYWTWPVMKDSSCIDEGTEMMVVAIVLCIADLLTTITPIPLIMRLQMPLKQRIGACVLLGLGLLVTFAGIARTYYIWKALIGSWDMTWWVYALWICSIVELNVAVLCACAPALKSLFNDQVRPMAGRINSKLNSIRSNSEKSLLSRREKIQPHQRWIPNPFHRRQDLSGEWDEEEARYDSSASSEKSASKIRVLQDDEPPKPPAQARRAEPRAAYPRLEIMMRHSIDQESAYVGQAVLSPGSGKFGLKGSSDSQTWRSKASVTGGDSVQ